MIKKTENPIKDLAADPVIFNADLILAQIHPQLRGDISKQDRPSDVRVILRTASLGGQACSFPNHGHPDNEMSTVSFDGESAIMVMPEGETARKQLFSALQIVSRMQEQGLTHITPEFLNNSIVNKSGLSHRFAAQVYGPAPFTAQADRLVDTAIPGQNGNPEIIKPVREDGYAVGMRAPVKEEAFLLVYMGQTENLFLKGGAQAATLLAKIQDVLSVKMNGANTALEALDGLNMLAKAIVLAVDAGSGKTKPIRLETARDIFQLQNMNWVFVDSKGQVTDQRLKISASTPFPK